MMTAQDLSHLLSGLCTTTFLTLSSLSIGLSMAIAMTAIYTSGHILLKKMIWFYLFFIRGTPLLVQFFLIYYGTGQFLWIRESIAWHFLKEPMACAIIALSINTACYTTVLLIGAMQSVPAEEIDAAAALGLGKWLAFRKIIFPRAFRLALPAYSNEVLMILKSTSLASTITLSDLMGVTQNIIARTYDTVTPYCLVGAIYLALNAIVFVIFAMLKKRYCHIMKYSI